MIAIADCNSFYCSCEKLFRPDLIGKPVVVLSNNDGCIVSRTDEAKKLGIDMAVPYFQCKDIMLQHGVTTFSSNYHLYGDMSQRVMNTFRDIMGEETVEVYSVDEAFINFNHVPEADYYSRALHLKLTTEQNTGIPICVGIAPNKLLSKLANKLAKKDKAKSKGVYVLGNMNQVNEALMNFPIGDLWGIGRRYEAKLLGFGIQTAWQFRNLPKEWVRKNFGGVVGERLWRQLHGESISEMNDPLISKKQILTSRMFGRPVTSITEIEEAIATYTARAAEKLRRQNDATADLTVFLLYRNTNLPKGQYGTLSSYRSIILPNPTSDTIELTKVGKSLARTIFFSGRSYIKGGIMFQKIVPDINIQGNLFHPEINLNKLLMSAIDNINSSQGPDTITVGAAGKSKTWKMRQEMRSPLYTTRWDALPLVH